MTQSPSEIKSIDGTTVLETHEDFVRALGEIDTEIAARCRTLYDQRREIREAMVDRFPPPALPSRRNRTDKQALIARCPRCNGKISDDVSD